MAAFSELFDPLSCRQHDNTPLSQSFRDQFDPLCDTVKVVKRIDPDRTVDFVIGYTLGVVLRLTHDIVDQAREALDAADPIDNSLVHDLSLLPYLGECLL